MRQIFNKPKIIIDRFKELIETPKEMKSVWSIRIRNNGNSEIVLNAIGIGVVDKRESWKPVIDKGIDEQEIIEWIRKDNKYNLPFWDWSGISENSLKVTRFLPPYSAAVLRLPWSLTESPFSVLNLLNQRLELNQRLKEQETQDYDKREEILDEDGAVYKEHTYMSIDGQLLKCLTATNKHYNPNFSKIKIELYNNGKRFFRQRFEDIRLSDTRAR